MGKRRAPSVAEIKEWVEEGWKFRIKETKNRRYITRRKGANVERSLGPYRSELWDKIQSIIEETDANGDTGETRVYNPREIVNKMIQVNRGGIKSLTCLNRDGEGFCMYWRWDSEYGFLRYLEDSKSVYKKVKAKDDKEAVLFLAENFYCMGCGAYISEEMKKALHP